MPPWLTCNLQLVCIVGMCVGWSFFLSLILKYSILKARRMLLLIPCHVCLVVSCSLLLSCVVSCVLWILLMLMTCLPSCHLPRLLILIVTFPFWMVLLVSMNVSHFVISWLRSSKILIVLGLLMYVVVPKMVVACFSIVMVYCVSLLVITFVLLCHHLSPVQFVLFCQICIHPALEVIWDVKSFLLVWNHVFIGRTCISLLISSVVSVLFVSKIRLVRRNRLENCSLLKILIVVLITFLWTLWLICLKAMVLMGSLQLLIDFLGLLDLFQSVVMCLLVMLVVYSLIIGCVSMGYLLR